MKTKHRVRVVAASVAGPLHCHKKLPCQDYFKFRREGKNFVAVVSDGAGSARYGKVGARVICETLIDHLKNTRPHQIIERTCQAVEAARRKLSLHRLNKGKKAENLNDFAATIVGVVYNEGQGCFFHIGDGAALAFNSDGDLRDFVASRPENGNFSCETFFYTQDNWKENLRFTRFENFDIADNSKCRIMVEWYISKRKIPIKKITQLKFNSLRFEIGINGLELVDKDGKRYIYTPTDAITYSHMGFKNALTHLLRKTPIRQMTNSISKRLDIFYRDKSYTSYITTSRAVVSYYDGCVPLYRCNKLYDDFSFDELKMQFSNSIDWLVKNMLPDGRFLYYYDCTEDSTKDHEHPARTEDNRYYNDLRHNGGIVALIRAYCFSGNKK